MFFNNLYKAMKCNETFGDGTRIFNLDETATVTVQKSAKVTSGEKGVLVTTCRIVSAAENHLPPAMGFPRVYFKEHMIVSTPPGTLGLAYPSGWMNADLFLKVMEPFIKHTSSSKENPSLLLYDNHESHLSIQVINLAKKNCVTIVTFLPHSTNKMQPLDVGIFKPFSIAYNAAIDSWLMHHPGKPVTIYQVAGFVGEAYQKAMTSANITSAFKKCRIFPFDREIFTDIDFLPCSVTDRPQLELGNQTPPREPIDDQTKLNANRFITSEEIRQFPKAEPRKETSKGRRKGKSMIPTDTPEKLELEERQVKKAIHSSSIDVRKKKSVKRKIQDRDEDDEEWHSDASSEHLEPEVNPRVDPTAFEDLSKFPEVEDYVLVEFKPENIKSKPVYYIGKVLSYVTETNEANISFMRKSQKTGSKFYFPVIPDIATMPVKDVKMILPRPLNYRYTK
ncbi:uncharacterized protein LOC126735215 [Anthonomus grandis grandis]|uniref:uncharacterized protein LOC126735215 n=1 Tax=Anthonomus grandis grandis TaxID=2921223 RepID=UPI00216649EB|nr:uncharacterized protein LOC126735215 [Anthonomus grandis grandis]